MHIYIYGTSSFTVIHCTGHKGGAIFQLATKAVPSTSFPCSTTLNMRYILIRRSCFPPPHPPPPPPLSLSNMGGGEVTTPTRNLLVVERKNVVIV